MGILLGLGAALSWGLADYTAAVAGRTLGATRVVPWTYAQDHDHVVMAAPDGNEFCVVQSPFTQG